MNISQIEKIVEANREEAIQFLVDAISIPSVTGEELEISKFFEKKFGEMELDTQVITLDENRPNLIASWKGENGPTLLFNGHYDVFPPVPSDPGLYGPWSGKIVDGYIYGRGTVDMKGGLCASVLAVDFLKKNGFEPKGTIVLSCDSDEEDGGKYGIEYVLCKGLLKADYGISMEPTRSKVQTEGSGGIYLEISYKSNSWWSGEQREEMSALQKAITAAQRLYKLDQKIRREKYYAPLKGGSFLSITKFIAGEKMNIHAGECTFIVDRHLTPLDSPEEAQAEICRELDLLKTEYADMDYEINLLSRMPALKVDEDHPIIHAALDAYKEVYKKDGEIYKRTGGSDNHKIAEKYGICIPNFGPGMDTEEATMPNEKLLIQEYLNMIKIYMSLITKMVGA